MLVCFTSISDRSGRCRGVHRGKDCEHLLTSGLHECMCLTHCMQEGSAKSSIYQNTRTNTTHSQRVREGERIRVYRHHICVYSIPRRPFYSFTSPIHMHNHMCICSMRN